MTLVRDEVAELNAGKITAKQLGERWATRKWAPITKTPRTVDAISEIETDSFFGTDNSWSEVEDLYSYGVLSRADYAVISTTIDRAKGRMSAAAPSVGHRLPTKIELAAQTDFPELQRIWQTRLGKLLSLWGETKKQQIEDLENQIENGVNNGSVDQVASVLTEHYGTEIILEHMTMMMEDSVVQAKKEAEAQGITLPTIDTSEVVRRLKAQASGTGQILARSISNSAATQALTRYGVQDMSGADVAAAVGQHLDDLSDSYTSDMLGGALNYAQNEGRTLVFQQTPGTYYSSELLDKNCCENCEAVDGTQYDNLSDAQSDYSQGGFNECLGGPRCRGTIVAVYDEATTPDDSDDGDSDSDS